MKTQYLPMWDLCKPMRVMPPSAMAWRSHSCKFPGSRKMISMILGMLFSAPDLAMWPGSGNGVTRNWLCVGSEPKSYVFPLIFSPLLLRRKSSGKCWSQKKRVIYEAELPLWRWPIETQHRIGSQLTHRRISKPRRGLLKPTQISQVVNPRSYDIEWMIVVLSHWDLGWTVCYTTNPSW